ncbi:MAG: leucine--tRNA ligase, partial [Candidatus Woesearchaeota archaeon]
MDNVQQIEKKWQKKWSETHTFEPKIDPHKEPFVVTVAYPYANSIMHIGHGRTFTMADIFARFQRLKGKNVLYPMGFHISGTPVLAVADAIAQKDPKQLAQTKEAIATFIADEQEQEKILDSFTEPQNIAAFFSSKIADTFTTIGLGIDWTRSFTTGDKTYQKFIEWQFHKLKEVGMIKQGSYPILYSPLDENAVGEDDIKDGDVQKVSILEMTYILFERQSAKNEFFCATTLRPDALFGATNMWLHPESTLCKIQVEDQIWIVTKDVIEKITHQFHGSKILSEHPASEFMSEYVNAPIIEKSIPIIPATFVDPSHGTGVVYSSPAGSPHDFLALQEAIAARKIDTIDIPLTVTTRDAKGKIIAYGGTCPADDKCQKYSITSSDQSEKIERAKQELYKEEHYGGTLNDQCREFSGLLISHAKPKIFAKLKELHLGGMFYETSRKAWTRSNKPVIVGVLQGQWFLDYSQPEIKEKAHAVLDSLEYKPANLKQTQKDYLDWVSHRPCARKRGIGTPLPFDTQWVIESLSDSTIYQVFYFLSAQIQKRNIPVDMLTPDFFDAVFFGKEVGDTTLAEYIKPLQTEFEYWKCVHLRYTNKPHMSNHLSFLLYHYGVIFSPEHWPKNITIGGLLIKDGQKISKSKGNGIPLQKVQELYGSDVYRLYVALGANYETDMDFKDSEIFQLQKKYHKLLEYLTNATTHEKKAYDSYTDLDRWLISRFYSHVKSYFTLCEEYKIREAYISVLYEFLQDCAYHQEQTSFEQTAKVIQFFLEDYILVLTPVIPHMCEELNEKLGNTELISLKSFETDIDQYIDTYT